MGNGRVVAGQQRDDRATDGAGTVRRRCHHSAESAGHDLVTGFGEQPADLLGDREHIGVGVGAGTDDRDHC